MYVLNNENISIEKSNKGKVKIRMTWKLLLLFLFVGLSGIVGAYVYGNKMIEDFNAVFVSHTEYWLDDTANIIVRLTNYVGQPITGATCNASLIYQDGSDTYMFQNQPMSASVLAGNYYYNFTLDSGTYPLGVYTKQVDCYVGVHNRTITTTFHVNPALEYLKSIGGNVTGVLGNLDEVNQTAWNIYNDTQYISSNMVTATNFDNWKTEVRGRLTDIDGNLTLIEDFCGNTETNSSELCQEIYNIRAFQISTNDTYTNYFENVTTTSTNIWNYMTGTLATNVNNIYNLLVSVNDTVVDTNQNVTAMRQDQLDEINLVIIS